MNQTLTLKKPIEAHGETVTVLTFREPTGYDLTNIGMPVQSNGEGQSKMDGKVVGALISALAGIPPSSVGAMSGQDWVRASVIVCGFLDDGRPPS